jgi:Putative auto-transporter adhesin, head GIN domain
MARNKREEPMYKHFITHVMLVVLLAASGLLAACGLPMTTVGGSLSGSGKMATRDLAIEGFTGIDARNGFDVTVTGGDAFKVAVTSDDNVLDAISVKKVGDRLQLAVDGRGQSVHTTRLEAAIMMPELKEVSLDSGSRLTVADPAPRGTSLKLTQKAGTHSDLSAMPVQTANVTLDAGSSADVNVTEKLDYTLRAGSKLRYTGNPAIGVGKNLEGSSATPY